VYILSTGTEAFMQIVAIDSLQAKAIIFNLTENRDK
jgi:hypothetical protein